MSGEDAGGVDLIFAGSLLHLADGSSVERAQVGEFVCVFLQRMAGDEEAEYFFLCGEALDTRPTRERREVFLA